MRPLEANDPRSIGSYTLSGVLGRGGMGKVYLGQSWTGKRVAIKVIRTEIADDPVFRQRFAREVEAGRAISALYTAPIVDADPHADTPWFATTYIEGPSLEDEVAARGPMSVASVLILAAGLAEAFIAIHRAGLVHRDLKPSNVLLTQDGPCVIDFGIALVPDATSLTLGVIGTPAYMSPEHIAGAEVGPSSDIFSIGATLAFAATGSGPLGQGTPHSLLARLIAGQLDTSGVPDQLKPIIHRCLARNPQYRPSATELLGILASAGAIRPYAGWYSPATPASPAGRPGVPVSAPPIAGLPAAGLPAAGLPAAAAGGWPPAGLPAAQPRAGAAPVIPAAPVPPTPPAGPPAYRPAAPVPAPAAPAPHGPPAQMPPATRPYGTPAQAPPIQPQSPVQPPPRYPVPPGRFPVGQASPYQPSGPPYTAGPAYPPATTQPRRSLLVPILVAVALLLVGVGITAGVVLINLSGNFSNASSTDGPSVPPTGTTQSRAATPTPARTTAEPPRALRIVAPQTLAGLDKSSQADLQSSADDVVTELKDELDSEKDAVAAFYTDPKAAGKLVLFVGITADIVSPVTEIDATFTSFNSSSEVQIGNITEVAAGPLGGKAKCGNGKNKDVTVVLCVWGDNESLGMAVFYNRSVTDSAALFVQIRNEASTRA